MEYSHPLLYSRRTMGEVVATHLSEGGKLLFERGIGNFGISK